MEFARANKAGLIVLAGGVMLLLTVAIFLASVISSNSSEVESQSAENGIEMPEGWTPVPAPEGQPGVIPPVEPLSLILVDQAIDLEGYEPGIAGFDIQPAMSSAVVMIALEEDAYAIFLEAANLPADTSAERIQLTEATVSHWFDLNTIQAGIENFQGNSFDDPPTDIVYDLVATDDPVKSVDFFRNIPAPIEWAPTSENPGVEIPDSDKD